MRGVQVDAEGWFQDPYGRHVDRWFSDGQPTKLVRDGEAESYDPPPPDPPPAGPLVPSALHGPDLGPDGLLRADRPEEDPDYGAVGMDRITRLMPPGGL